MPLEFALREAGPDEVSKDCYTTDDAQDVAGTTMLSKSYMAVLQSAVIGSLLLVAASVATAQDKKKPLQGGQ